MSNQSPVPSDADPDPKKRVDEYRRKQIELFRELLGKPNLTWDELMNLDKKDDHEAETPIDIEEPLRQKPRESEYTEPRIIKLPKDLDLDGYAELYAQRKNLFHSKGFQEKLRAESEKAQSEITEYVKGRITIYLAEHPEVSSDPEAIRQKAMHLYVIAQNELQRRIIARIDGEKGSVLRKFNALMDKHGRAIKMALAATGVVGLGILTGGVATGAIVPAFALGWGTGIGALKGAAIGGLMSRHGSKESAVREIVQDKEIGSADFKELVASLSPEDQKTFSNISRWLVEQNNAAASADHKLNWKRTRRAGILGGALGALVGSTTFNSPHDVDKTTWSFGVESREFPIGDTGQIEVPNPPPTVDSNIQIGGWHADGSPNGVNSSADVFARFFGGSQADYPPEMLSNLAQQAGVDWSPGNTLAFAGNLSDPANSNLLNMLQYYANNVYDSGTHMEPGVTGTINTPVPTINIDTYTTTELTRNIPATIAGWLAGGTLGSLAVKQASDSTRLGGNSLTGGTIASVKGNNNAATEQQTFDVQDFVERLDAINPDFVKILSDAGLSDLVKSYNSLLTNGLIETLPTGEDRTRVRGALKKALGTLWAEQQERQSSAAEIPGRIKAPSGKEYVVGSSMDTNDIRNEIESYLNTTLQTPLYEGSNIEEIVESRPDSIERRSTVLSENGRRLLESFLVNPDNTIVNEQRKPWLAFINWVLQSQE